MNSFILKTVTKFSYILTGICATYLFSLLYTLQLKIYFMISNYDWNFKTNHIFPSSKNT